MGSEMCIRDSPIARLILKTVESHNNEVGDGTLSLIILICSLLNQAEKLIVNRVHPSIIIDGYSIALEKALEYLNEKAVRIDPDDKEQLKRIAKICMTSKFTMGEIDYLSEIVTEAILSVKQNNTVDLEDIKICKRPGGKVRESQLIKGLIIENEVVYEFMPKRIENARIAILYYPLEIPRRPFHEDIPVNVNVSSLGQMRAIKKAEEEVIKEKTIDLLHSIKDPDTKKLFKLALRNEDATFLVQ